MMDKILISTSSFANNDPKLLDTIGDQGFHVFLNPYGRKLAEFEVAELIEEYQPTGMIAGVEPLTENVLKKAMKLKVISRCGIGMDSVDLEAARDLGIVVTNTPDAPTIPVAELTLGMILSLLRRIQVSDASIRKGNWERPMGSLLRKKTVGIIGCGRIGSYLARLLTPFGCKVLGYDVVQKKSEFYQSVSLKQIFNEANIVTLHIPYSSEDYHFMNAERINAIKQGAILVNAARGGLVDEDALYDALVSGHLSGAAVDCFEQEPYNGKLKDLENVLLTAHIGSYAKEGRVMMERQAVENLLLELKKAGCIA
jgi:D-3-phosphoglycerate dehydrogenase